MDYEISKQLLPLYNYTYDRLVEGNIKSDPAMIQEAIDIIKELRDAWAQAMKKARQEKGTKNVQGDFRAHARPDPRPRSGEQQHAEWQQHDESCRGCSKLHG